MNFTGPATPLSDGDILAEAARLGCEPSAIRAVCDVESAGSDETAALEAASWGLFQILGSNFAMCGFASVQDYVAAMCRSEADHLAAFGEFCRHGGLDRYLGAQDWTRFALAYNGPAESDNGYDEKLAAAYRARRATSQ